ncbi:hypothetical protein [Absidia glauca]|uniref:Copper-fist domain-containing protein n=1 Tax=Absidia glauca TaxID=4829 RepID=A0A163ISE9_ABSGL|nr:hypothetical protein [Absidia glauca]
MAVDKDGVKHACMQCIRGHRVKKCNHLDRQLVPLLKRGRQVSQCNHCRGLRSSGSHVKCTCATSAVPNPHNGCLCELVQVCTCVARHLQNTQIAIDRSPVALVALDTPSPLSLSSASPTIRQEDSTHPSPKSPVMEDTISAIPTTTNTSIPSDLGADNMDQHDFLLSTFSFTDMIQTPPYEAEADHTINQERSLSFNTQLDAPSQWNISRPPFDDIQMDSTPTSFATATATATTNDTPGNGTIDVLDLFLHQDINDLLTL